MPVPATRIRILRARPADPAGSHVLYWMHGARRRHFNWALQRAVEHARTLSRPLIIASDLRLDAPWASTRHHRFVLAGMLDGVRARRPRGVRYLPLVEREAGAALRAIELLAGSAAVVVVDDLPWSDLVDWTERLAQRSRVLVEAIDGWGLLPMRAAPRVFPTAFAFRCFLQKELGPHLVDLPARDPLAGEPLPPCPAVTLPSGLAPCDVRSLARLLEDPVLPGLPREDAPRASRGGSVAGRARLRSFLGADLVWYAEDRNDPDAAVASGLSAWLHHGQISVFEIWASIARRECWSPDRLGLRVGGKKQGWWGLSASTEAFLDELVTWRELGPNFCSQRADWASYDSLPAWARITLEKHASDVRPHIYTLDELAASGTHDAIWNAAQRQLVAEGRIHNYLRMLWGKKILEWSASPREALRAMIELNNRYALDGQDPNSYSGIFWTLGRYDRPWAPERKIFGTIRYMSSENTRRKLRLKTYLERYGEAPGLFS